MSINFTNRNDDSSLDYGSISRNETNPQGTLSNNVPNERNANISHIPKPAKFIGSNFISKSTGRVNTSQVNHRKSIISSQNNNMMLPKIKSIKPEPISIELGAH